MASCLSVWVPLLADQIFMSWHHPHQSNLNGIATKDSHFIHEGSGLGTFHKTLHRLLHFYSVPNTQSDLAAFQMLAPTHDDAPDGCLIVV